MTNKIIGFIFLIIVLSFIHITWPFVAIYGLYSLIKRMTSKSQFSREVPQQSFA